jgi:hypothetical protein
MVILIGIKLVVRYRHIWDLYKTSFNSPAPSLFGPPCGVCGVNHRPKEGGWGMEHVLHQELELQEEGRWHASSFEGC